MICSEIYRHNLVDNVLSVLPVPTVVTIAISTATRQGMLELKTTSYISYISQRNHIEYLKVNL